ncbi:MAG: FAD-dependent oxidoreductase, partial [Rhodospirillales bacterium]|nr:FAD-dependent oxidoreductase [Rhodospirillales bacterium]
IRAGWDGVELTSFMGYLLANFCSPFTNQRTDEYGGSVKNRARFMIELLESVKEAIDDHPLVVRLNGTELMDRWGGSSTDECFEHIEIAGQTGVDMISITVGWQESPESSIGRDIAPGNWNHLAARAKKLLPHIPVTFGVRLPDPVMANECIEKGEFDYWEVCRPLLADPEMVHKAREGRLDERKRCVGSLNCLSRLFRDLPYTCTVNPALGHEYEPEYNITPPANLKRVMIVGAGPAGMECAMAARRRGHAVTVYEKEDKIGGALRGYAANDLANREDLESLVSHYEVSAKKLGIEIKLNTAPDPKMMRTLMHQYDVVVLATGASIDMEHLPPIEDGARVLDAMDVALGKEKPGDSIVVVHGGKIGLTLAESLTRQGKKAVVVEPQRRLAHDVSPTWKWRHSAWIKELGIEAMTSTRVTDIRKGQVSVIDGEGNERILEADTVIIAGPSRPNQGMVNDFQWMVDETYATGDATIPRDLTQAIHDGYRLGCRI